MSSRGDVMASKKPDRPKKKQAGHLIRVSDEHWGMLKARADAEARTVPLLVRLAIDAYFRNNPEPLPPPK